MDSHGDRRQKRRDIAESVPSDDSRRRVTAAEGVPHIKSWDKDPKQATHFVCRLPAEGGKRESPTAVLRMPVVKRRQELYWSVAVAST